MEVVSRDQGPFRCSCFGSRAGIFEIPVSTRSLRQRCRQWRIKDQLQMPSVLSAQEEQGKPFAQSSWATSPFMSFTPHGLEHRPPNRAGPGEEHQASGSIHLVQVTAVSSVHVSTSSHESGSSPLRLSVASGTCERSLDDGARG